MRKNIMKSLIVLVLVMSMLVSQPVFASSGSETKYTIRLLNGEGSMDEYVSISNGIHTNLTVFVVSGPGSTVSISYWANNDSGARITDSATATNYGVALSLALKSGYRSGKFKYYIYAKLTATSSNATRTVIKTYEA